MICFSQTWYYLGLFYRIKEEDVRLMLWDTAGQEEFDAITKSYYRGEKKTCLFRPRFSCIIGALHWFWILHLCGFIVNMKPMITQSGLLKPIDQR